jgi:hypothetical protein
LWSIVFLNTAVKWLRAYMSLHKLILLTGLSLALSIFIISITPNPRYIYWASPL